MTARSRPFDRWATTRLTVAVLGLLLVLSSCSSTPSYEAVRSDLLQAPWIYTVTTPENPTPRLYRLTFGSSGSFTYENMSDPAAGQPDGPDTWSVDNSTRALTICFDACSTATLTSGQLPDRSFGGTTPNSSGSTTTWTLTRADRNPPTVAAGSPPATSSESPAPSLVHGVKDLTDTDGYTYRVTYDATRFEAPDISIADDKPGQASATIHMDGSIEVVNTTPGRNAPPSYPYLVGLYRSSRVACTLALTRVQGIATGTAYPGYCGIGLLKTPAQGVPPAAPEFSKIDENLVRSGAADIVRGPDVWILASGTYYQEFRDACELDADNGLGRPNLAVDAQPSMPGFCRPTS